MRKVLRSELVIGERIGKGTFGSVFRATWCGTPHAVKELHLGDTSDTKLEALTKEADLLSALQHTNVVHMMGGDWKAAKPFIVLELAETSLAQVARCP